jgi:hypothetical protein
MKEGGAKKARLRDSNRLPEADHFRWRPLSKGGRAADRQEFFNSIGHFFAFVETKHARLQGTRPAGKAGRYIGQSPLRRLGRDQIKL